MELTKQAGQFASSPMADPTKNPNLREGLDAQAIDAEGIASSQEPA